MQGEDVSELRNYVLASKLLQNIDVDAGKLRAVV